ncbi:LPXTG cell wall anchor domain-containing protein [Streptococcus sciuri]|uniref:LPXTG cell wall anchor domain-containing protein n=1 Tax=Streptococcus sciuri TaxID=2973939 RepID=A0ABT2F7W5_9STRE|nr:LPXTG cell wall anchor domain-containing protein [Streptococcus sciuri]MCS4488556.1 LPXTG cell wall anchor domain-containing protein [Streptococcus sciuri]
MNKTLKSLAATTALAIAAVGAPAFADEATQAKADTPDKPVVTAEAPKTETAQSSDAKAQVATAQDTENQADKAVTTAQANVDTAKEAVKDAETNVANATPENIAAHQADKATNLSEQKANATATATATTAKPAPAVDTAQSEKDAADADVATKEATVQSAQAAVDGTGKAEAPIAPTDDKATKAKELDLLKTILATSNDIMLNKIQTSDEQVYFLGMPTEEQSKKLHQALDDYSKLTGKTELAINGQQYSRLGATLGLYYNDYTNYDDPVPTLKERQVVQAYIKNEIARLEKELSDSSTSTSSTQNNTTQNSTKVTLPNGTVINVPNGNSPVKPNGTKDSTETHGSHVTGSTITKDGKTTVVPTSVKPTGKSAQRHQGEKGEKATYSRVARHHQLPQTGEKASALSLLGLGLVSALGFAGMRKSKKEV